MPVNYPIHRYSEEILTKVPADQMAFLPRPESIPKRRYSTSIDPRNFLTVYEYKVGDHWIIWDYYTGLVHLTGLWKAIGNHKADIVKLVESSPELEKELRRIRGGFLKIQGTWIPYSIAKVLASKFCYSIRYVLIPLFGEDFVELCLKPYDRGFGMLRLRVTEADLKRRRNRRRPKGMGIGTVKVKRDKGNAIKVRRNSTKETFRVALQPTGPMISRSPAFWGYPVRQDVVRNYPYILPRPTDHTLLPRPIDHTLFPLASVAPVAPSAPVVPVVPVVPVASLAPKTPVTPTATAVSPHQGLLSVLKAAQAIATTLPTTSPCSASVSLASSFPTNYYYNYNYVPISATRTTIPILAKPDTSKLKTQTDKIKRRMSIDCLIRS
ncbi:hypothetical protein FOA43_002278 [Brettanomyces nanus]|uniref:HTH APSES-type domain-containing protein n=1 Tax=Eeniella nana TaxID=13502 RepID=A0A875RPE3_EENNA|nr:uncharacterized protein FOA43_002278 [Brettanomyces nanus]QPG74940.1 hypothetical protein FOA43_002278 [Brettanomyces nanus]